MTNEKRNRKNSDQSGGGDLPNIDFSALREHIKSQPAPASEGRSRRNQNRKPSRPNRAKLLAQAKLIGQVLPADRISNRNVSIGRVNSLLEIAKLAGEKPNEWQKPAYGEFDYHLAHNCGWIDDEEFRRDTENFRIKRRRALGSSSRFSSDRYGWGTQPRFEVAEARDYVPQISMKVVNDRNLTDSARRIVMFIMRHVYQDARAERFIGMTVSFIMEGLALSRRTVQRCLTLLETLGYLRCEVATGAETKMCVGLIINLLSPLFPEHHKKKWPKHRTKSGASSLSQKQNRYIKNSLGYADKALKRVGRLTWALKCLAGVARTAYKVSPSSMPSAVPQCRGFKAMRYFHPEVQDSETSIA